MATAAALPICQLSPICVQATTGASGISRAMQKS